VKDLAKILVLRKNLPPVFRIWIHIQVAPDPDAHSEEKNFCENFRETKNFRYKFRETKNFRETFRENENFRENFRENENFCNFS
jgi:hypothetical protein